MSGARASDRLVHQGLFIKLGLFSKAPLGSFCAGAEITKLSKNEPDRGRPRAPRSGRAEGSLAQDSHPGRKKRRRGFFCLRNELIRVSLLGWRSAPTGLSRGGSGGVGDTAEGRNRARNPPLTKPSRSPDIPTPQSPRPVASPRRIAAPEP